jgi:hypothetical protein
VAGGEGFQTRMSRTGGGESRTSRTGGCKSRSREEQGRSREEQGRSRGGAGPAGTSSSGGEKLVCGCRPATGTRK